MAARRGSRDSRSPGKEQNSCWDIWKSLPGSHGTLWRSSPPSRAQCWHWSEGLDQSGMRRFLPSELTEASPQKNTTYLFWGLHKARGKSKSWHMLLYTDFFLQSSNQHTSTYKKPLYWLKITLHMEIRWLMNWCLTGPFLNTFQPREASCTDLQVAENPTAANIWK